jgi:hypothetical protein
MPSVNDEPSVNDDQVELWDSWQRTRGHLNAAREQLTDLRAADDETVQEWLDHNELGLAFDTLVDLAHELDVPVAFWEALDRAAQEMHLYADALRKPHLTTTDFVLRHLAVAHRTPRTLTTPPRRSR